MPNKPNRYSALLAWVFTRYYTPEARSIEWERNDLVAGARELGIDLPKNLGDVTYSVRYRTPFPQVMLDAAPDGYEWVLRGRGRAKYSFDLVKNSVRITPNEHLTRTKIPDATPELIAGTALGDEQALLAVVRYNRLIDTFLGITAYSLQNHLRTTVQNIGQVEIDEVYVGVDTHGRQFVIPVQAKGGNDQIGITQIEQDLAVCSEKWPDMIARPVAAQFAADGLIALFELAVQDDEVRLAREAHYSLVAGADITAEDLALYRRTVPS